MTKAGTILVVDDNKGVLLHLKCCYPVLLKK